MLLLALAALADDRFYPGADDTLTSYADTLGHGIVGRSGRVLVEGPAALATLPEVAAARALPGGVWLLTPKAGVDDLAFSRALHARADVAWALPDLRFRLVPAAVPDDPLLAYEWHLDNVGQSGTAGVDINAPAAWDHATGDGQLIAVIDSGVQLDHPELVVTPGHDYVDGDDDPSPDGSWDGNHGTSVAGVAAAVGNDGYGVAGVAYDADVYAIRLIGGDTSLGDLYDAFTEAVDAGAGVLSNSWGFSSSCEVITDYSTFRKMFKYAEEEGRGGLGSVVVFAAGNGGCDMSTDGMLAHEEPIVVAAVESGDVRASYSNYGEAVDIAAPTNLLTTDITPGGYGNYGGDDAFADGFSGTSAAAPVVSGVVALMLQANPRLTAEEVRAVICATATRNDLAGAAYDADGRSPYYGCGRIDAGAAVAAVVSLAPDAPTPTLVRAEVPEGQARAVWTAATDADGDVQGYELAVWRAGESEEDAPVTTVAGTMSPLEAEAGETISWKVRAVDTWGPGEWSVVTTFTVVAIPEETAPVTEPEEETGGGCATVPGAGGLATLVGMALVMGAGRRNRR